MAKNTSRLRPPRPAVRKPPSGTKRVETVGTMDGLENLVTGLGTDKDKMTGVNWAFAPLDHGQAQLAYRGDWIARKLVDIPAQDSTREWRSWQGDADAITLIEGAEQSLGVQKKLKLAIQKARLFGGAAIILGINQGTNEEEVDLDRIKEGDLQFIHVVSRHEIVCGPLIDDVTSPYYGEPSYYERTSRGDSAMVRFHPSRVVPLVGVPLPDLFQSNDPWGDSILQSVSDAIKSAGMVSSSVAQLVAESKIDIVKIPGLSLGLSNKSYEDRLTRRFSYSNVIKGVYSMLLLDKEEEWERQSAAFTALPDVLQMFFLLVCGAADIPATRFFGQSPAGLSATGESDIRNYYDSISSYQKNDISPVLWRLDEVLIRSALGSRPEEIFYIWNSLWQMTDAQRAELASKKAAIFKIDVDAGVIDPAVLKRARENQLIEDGTYPGLESIIDEYGEDEDVDGDIDGEEDPPEDRSAEGSEPEAGNDAETEAERRRRRAADAWNRSIEKTRSRRGRSSRGKRVELIEDATPRTLYVSRPVINADVILDWARSQGFTSALLPEDLHVTLIYSKAEVDWVKMGEAFDEDERGFMRIKPGGPRMMERFGKAVTLVFGSSSLSWRHESLKHLGASSDYEDYNPHITITYKGAPEDLSRIEPYRGEIVLGPEVFREIKTGFNNETDVPEEDL